MCQMYPEIKERFEGRRIKKVIVQQTNIGGQDRNDILATIIVIFFENYNDVLHISVHEDRSSANWFEELDGNIGKIVGKTFKSIFIAKRHIDLPPSDINEVDYNRIVTLRFEDKTKFRFYWRNSSDGDHEGFIKVDSSRDIYDALLIE